MNGILHPILKKTQPVMLRKRKMTSGRSQENSFIHRHHVVPRVKLYVPQEETFPIPTKYIDVSRTTRTSFDVLMEKPKGSNAWVWHLQKISGCGVSFVRKKLTIRYFQKLPCKSRELRALCVVLECAEGLRWPGHVGTAHFRA